MQPKKKKNPAARQNAPRKNDTESANEMSRQPQVGQGEVLTAGNVAEQNAVTENAVSAVGTLPKQGAAPRKNNDKIPMRVLKIFIAAAVVVLIGYFGFTCKVQEGNCAVILRFGAPREVITEAGLYFRLPWPFESVVSYEGRMQYFESSNLETTTKDKRNIILQSYVIWQVSDPLLYHNSVGSQNKIDAYINDQIFSATNGVMGAYNLSNLVSLETENIRTEEIQQKIMAQVKENCEAKYGITIADVSILRISLPDQNLESVFEQMKAERQKDIDTILANAQRDANIIMQEADTESSVIIAEGTTTAGSIQAQTEKEVARIYAEAQAANIELYQFLRNLDTLVASTNSESILVVKADTYPFNILTEYSKTMTIEGNNTVLSDLNYILNQLNETDRQALIDAIYQLINEAAGSGGGSGS